MLPMCFNSLKIIYELLFIFIFIFDKTTSDAPFYTGSLPCQGVPLSFATLQIYKEKDNLGPHNVEHP